MADGDKGVVIVAIPEENDPVWKYSSEKIPHITIAYLAEPTDLEQVAKYIQHVASLTPRFFMSVDRRGTLGAKNADVLFFNNKRPHRIASGLRYNLLTDSSINKAYLSTEQFPEWTPHLTMGYPDNPAKVDDREYGGFGSVHFDRLAIWMGDYDGPTFELTGSDLSWDTPMPEDSFAMSAEVGLFLEHAGVKGMKWGVRNDANTKQAKAAESRINSGLAGFNSKVKPGSKQADYDKELTKYVSGNLGVKKGTPKVSKTSYTRLEFVIDVLWWGTLLHADGGQKVLLQVELTRDADGKVTSVTVDVASADELEHSGVKGMRWGVRKDERPLSTQDVGLNIAQRQQVRVASAVSALASVGMATNAAATLFQLQNRWEHLQAVNAVIDQAQNNPFIGEAGKEALRQTKSNVIKGIVGSAMATTAVTVAIGVVTHRTAKAYFAPLHKVYGDVKPKINGEIRQLGKDIKTGKLPKLTTKQYNEKVAGIVQKHMTQDKSNILKPFHELARGQLGLQYNTKELDIKFEKLPNTDLMDKMTVTTPDGLVLVKAIKTVQHSGLYDASNNDLDYYFDYKFDAAGFISEFYSPTIEISQDLFEGKFNLSSATAKYDQFEAQREATVQHSVEKVDNFLAGLGLEGALKHKDAQDETVNDVINGLSPVQRSAADLVIVAALDGLDISGTEEAETYRGLSDLQKACVEFAVGALATGKSDAQLEHTMEEENALAHFGVKGMRWGVRNDDSGGSVSSTSTVVSTSRAVSSTADNRLSKSSANFKENRKAARQAVKAGDADLAVAHVAALKSKGHRALNFFLGDKKYYSSTAAITALTVAGVIASNAVAPGVLPAVLVLGGAAQTSAYVGVALRAFRGNARVNNSYAQLGAEAHASQREGSKAVKRVLGQSGGLRRKNIRPLKHTAELEEFMAAFEVVTDDDVEHHGVKGQRWGIRRKRKSDGTVTGTGDKPSVDENGDGKQDRLSADAERALKTTKKAQSELSTREMKEAVERARQIEAYNKIFNPDAGGSSKVQRRIDQLKQEKELRDLEASLAKPSKVKKLIQGAEFGFNTYQKIDSITKGRLTSGLKKQLGIPDPPKTAAERIAEATTALKLKNDLFNEQNRLQKLLKEGRDMRPPTPKAEPLSTPDFSGAANRPRQEKEKKSDEVYNITSL